MNFLSISLDDLNAFATLKDSYPGLVHTPNINRLAGLGTQFDNAFAQVALCNPSRASILSGLRPEATGVHTNFEVWHETVDAGATLPAVLSQAGYATHLVGKVFHQSSDGLPAKVLDAIGADAFSSEAHWNGGFTQPFHTGPLLVPESQHGDYINTSHAIDAMLAADGPFAMFLGLFKPHADWVVPQEYFDLYPLDEIELPFHEDGDLDDVPAFVLDLINQPYHEGILAQDFWKPALQAYFASISFADAQLGRVLDALETSGLIQDTAIVLWSDHGYHLGDKEHWHKFTLWEEAGRAPLIVYDPTAPGGGARIADPVELVDIFPTVLDLLGLGAAAPSDLAGASLAPYLADPTLALGGSAITTMQGNASIRTPAFRYIRYEDGSEELYDIVSDPHQYDNLALDPDYQAIKSDLKADLKAALYDGGWVWEGESNEASSADGRVHVGASGAPIYGTDFDDVYFLTDPDAAVIEYSGSGVDTIYVGFDFALPDFVENLFVKQRYSVDRLDGNDLANAVRGAAAEIHGHGGDDRLQLFASGVAYGGDGDDQVQGSVLEDRLDGGDGDDVLLGIGGDDLLVGGGGANVLDGGAGFDIVDYGDEAGGILLDLTGGRVERLAGVDQLASIEGVRDTPYADILAGDATDNVFWLSGGDDDVRGGRGRDVVRLPVLADAIVSAVRLPADGRIQIVYDLDGVHQTIVASGVESVGFADDASATVAALLGARPPSSDYDGDGGADLIFANPAKGVIWAMDGSGGPQTPYGDRVGHDLLAIADLDGDGAADLLWRNEERHVYAIRGDAGFVESFGPRDGARLHAVHDFDGDGGAELLFQDLATHRMYLLDGEGGFQHGFGPRPADAFVDAGDLDGDGGVDILLRNDLGEFYAVDFGGNIVASYGPRAHQTLRAILDFDGDGDADLLMETQATGALSILNGGGGFQQGFGSIAPGALVATGDLDGDGRGDLLLADAAGELFSIKGTGGLITGYGGRTVGELVGLADFDGDTGLDLLIRSADGKARVLDGNGGAQTAFGPLTIDALRIAGDLNGNGTADVVVRNGFGHAYTVDGLGGIIASYGARDGQTLYLFGDAGYPPVELPFDILQ